jgi:uncharacterized membrane protein YeaQ/YmgE (transglycosylase-associated protein family)
MYLGLDTLILWLIIGFLAGIIANALTRRHSNSALADVILGILGAGVGSIVMNLLGLYYRGFVGSLIAATVGAVILIWFYRRFMSKSYN